MSALRLAIIFLVVAFVASPGRVVAGGQQALSAVAQSDGMRVTDSAVVMYGYDSAMTLADAFRSTSDRAVGLLSSKGYRTTAINVDNTNENEVYDKFTAATFGSRTVVIYVMMHGYYDGLGVYGLCWRCADGVAVTADVLLGYIKSAKRAGASTVVLIADSCYSGALVSRLGHEAIVLASTQPDKQAWSSDGELVFSDAMLDCMASASTGQCLSAYRNYSFGVQTTLASW